MGCFGRQSKKQRCTIVLLDETDIVYDIESKTTGEQLLQFVFNNLNLLETAYFGLRYIQKSGESKWLDPTKKVFSQMTGMTGYTLYFGVKFYASDPCKLQEEITRYLFVLQIKQDIFQGRLIVSPELGVELFALSLQSELGDYDSRRHDKHYVSEFRFLPNQTPELEQKVAERHKSLTGQVSSMVEMTFLEKVKWLDMYGIDLHVVMGEDNVEYFLCLSPSGIIVMKNGKKVSNYFWPRITKVFFKGKYFMLRVINKANEENTYAFELLCKDACKYLWKCCIEHHAFFRLTQVKDVSGVPVNIFRLGSKHRYSGRTEQQIKADMKQIKRPPPTVVRVPSRRYPKRLGEPDGAEAENKVKEQNFRVLKSKDDLSLSLPSNSLTLYRSISTPAELSNIDNSVSNTPKVAPWENPNQKGLFSNSSRQSLCSSHASEKRYSYRSQPRGRSPSLNSEASTEYRRKRHKSKKSSDNESDISKSSRGSRGSRSSKNSHRKFKTHENTSDTDSCSKRRGRKHRNRGNRADLVDSDIQWKLVQQRQERNSLGPQSAVVRDLSNRKSGYMNSGIDTESEATMNHRRKQRRHSRSRSRSPESKHAISDDVKKHIKYNLIDPCSLTEEERKDIKYTKVETNSEVLKIRYSPASGRPRYKIAKVPSRTSLEKMKIPKKAEDAPPPYAISQTNGVNISQGAGKNIHHQRDVRKSLTYSTTGASDSSSSSMSTVLKPRNRNQHNQVNVPLRNSKLQNNKPANLIDKSCRSHCSGAENTSFHNSKQLSSMSDDSQKKKNTQHISSNAQEKINQSQVCKRQIGNNPPKAVNTQRKHELRTEL